MTENHFLQALRNLIVRRPKSSSIQGSSGNFESTSPAIYISEIEFRDGTKLALSRNSIILITGPNNSGKTSVLRQVAQVLSEAPPWQREEQPLSGPIVSHLDVRAVGTADEFRRYIEDRCFSEAAGLVRIKGKHSFNYKLDDVESDIRTHFRGSLAATLFVSWMNAAARLNSVLRAKREDWTTKTPSEPLQWLDFEIEAEDRISDAFKSTFGLSLVVNRVAGENLILHVAETDEPELSEFRQYVNWLSSLPLLEEQGDGMKSFAAALLGLMVHPKSVVLLDEPEAFLHHPQATRLAEIVAESGASNCQVWVATHNVDFVHGLLAKSNDRITVVRLDRRGNTSSAKVLEPEQIRTFWSDPLLSTSDALSALFHEVAVICEGETDVRFLRALAAANPQDARLPDAKLLHVGGKGKIEGIARALRALALPTCAVVDIDVLSDSRKFLELFAVLGGDSALIAEDVKSISRHVGQRNALITGSEFARSLRSVADEVEKEPSVSEKSRAKLTSLFRESGAWSRLKVDGYRGFESSTIVQAFERVYAKSKSIGLLINREGELESLCRDAQRNPKSAWLQDVLSRDLARDTNLTDALKLLSELRECMVLVRQKSRQ